MLSRPNDFLSDGNQDWNERVYKIECVIFFSRFYAAIDFLLIVFSEA